MKKSLENIEPSEARLLVEAGKSLVEIRDYLIPKGFSRPFHLDRTYELKGALRKYPKEKIQAYQNILEKHGLTEESEQLEENYTALERLSKSSKKHLPISLQHCGRLKK